MNRQGKSVFMWLVKTVGLIILVGVGFATLPFWSPVLLLIAWGCFIGGITGGITDNGKSVGVVIKVLVFVVFGAPVYLIMWGLTNTIFADHSWGGAWMSFAMNLAGWFGAIVGLVLFLFATFDSDGPPSPVANL